MLKRVANLLFWTGRNLERAEWRARMVDVNYHLLVESQPGGAEGWLPLLAITGDREEFAGRYAQPDEASVLTFFALDENYASSIRNCIALARENCRALRNRISSELWLELNTLYLDALRWTPEIISERGVYNFFVELRERFHQISGVVGATLPRDLGFDFLRAGKMLEAAENVTRLLDVKYHFLLPSPAEVGSPLDLAQWAALLRSASAREAYTATYGSTIRVDKIVDFLLFDPAFPRAARYCADQLEAALTHIESALPAGGAVAARIPSIAALAARLRGGSGRALVNSGLHEHLLEIQDDCSRIHDELTAGYLTFE